MEYNINLLVIRIVAQIIGDIQYNPNCKIIVYTNTNI